MATATLFFGHLLSDKQKAMLHAPTLVDAAFIRVIAGDVGIAVPDTLFEVGSEPKALPVQYVNKEKLAVFNKFAIHELGLPKLKATDSNWYLVATDTD